MSRIARALGEPILSLEPLSGGFTSDAHRVQTRNGTFFCKESHRSTSVFTEEAEGLKRLAAVGAFRCPEVHHCDSHLLILEWIETEPPTRAFWHRFGENLAAMHRHGRESYGFEIDNHIGATPQLNPLRSIAEISWADFFLEFRLKPMIRHPSLAVDPLLQALFQKAEPSIRGELELVREPPSLVHGDLWSGNLLCAVGGEPVLIDPAPYYGHREVDLAMIKLFGGFDASSLDVYRQSYPLAPGFDRRTPIYNLYHILNHAILFDGGYRDSARAILKGI